MKTALESAGIPYRTRNEGLTNLAQGMLVRVPEDQAEEARQLMSTQADVEEDGDVAS